MGYVDAARVRRLAEKYNDEYRAYLENIADEPVGGTW
jgi:hypothetical protein